MWSWGIDKVWATSHVGPKRFTPAGAWAGLGWGEPGQVDLGCSTAVSRNDPAVRRGFRDQTGAVVTSAGSYVLRTWSRESGRFPASPDPV